MKIVTFRFNFSPESGWKSRDIGLNKIVWGVIAWNLWYYSYSWIASDRIKYHRTNFLRCHLWTYRDLTCFSLTSFIIWAIWGSQIILKVINVAKKLYFHIIFPDCYYAWLYIYTGRQNPRRANDEIKKLGMTKLMA